MPPPIPDRWIPYKACGRVIEGTRIICFKVPLRKTVQVGKSDIKEIWDIKALLEKIPKLGAVIDLTNTSRYYDPRELQAAGILHKKILMPGRIIPPENKVQEFMDTVDEFLGKDCELLIGVHCTHGLNRTGYMVCRYMRDRLSMPAKDAIKKFEKARGYQIERENYIANLLGKEPPPPDVGKDTELKPIRQKDKDRMSYRSPLSGYEEDKNNADRFGSSHSRRRPNYDGTLWRSECQGGSGSRTSRSSEKRNRFDSNNSFDYKYDY